MYLFMYLYYIYMYMYIFRSAPPSVLPDSRWSCISRCLHFSIYIDIDIDIGI